MKPSIRTPGTSYAMHIVNAFASGPFTGNPAAVIATETALDETLMQRIAAQNNLSETAFVVTGETPMPLRWFTPKEEVPLCGHATLATAKVLFDTRYQDREELRFASASGELSVHRKGEQLQLDFPLRRPSSETPPSITQIADALNCSESELDECFVASTLVVVMKSQESLEKLKPDMIKLRALHSFAVAATAAGRSVDFTARFFAPNAGIDEDPVTGSAYTFLAPYWARRLGRESLSAQQLSARGGDLQCRLAGKRVLIAGRAQLYLKGEISI